jgi:predicted nucleic acid-binding protein
VIEEPESAPLARYLKRTPNTLVTSRIAVVEVLRAVTIANPRARGDASRLLESCLLVDVSAALLRAAARLASREIRTLDSIHLATAEAVSPDAVLTYDRRLVNAARRSGFEILAVS